MGLPERIKSIRLNEGLSQIDMAKKLGIASSTYQYYERGERIPPADFIVKLITMHGVDCEWLLLGEGVAVSSVAQQPLGMNLDFMKEVIEVLERELEKKRAKLKPDKKADLVILLYETLLKEEAGFTGVKRDKFLKNSVSKFIRLAS